MYLCCKPNAVQVRGSQARLPSQIIQYDLRLFKKLQNIETSHFNSEIKRTFANCWIQFISTNLSLTRQKKRKITENIKFIIISETTEITLASFTIAVQ